MFGAQLADIPGNGHVEDPAERSVLVEFESATFEEPGPAPNPGGTIDVSVVFNDFGDNHITFGGREIKIHQDNSVTIFNETTNVTEEVHQGDQVTIQNVNVTLGNDNSIRVGGVEFQIRNGVLRKTGDGTTAPGDPASKQWDVAFKTPAPGGEDLFAMIRRIADEVLTAQEATAVREAGQGDRTLMDQLESAVNMLGSGARQVVIDQLMERLDEAIPGAHLLRFVKFGQSEVPATITSVLTGARRSGIIRGPALSISTVGDSAPGLMTINTQREFQTELPRTLSSWDGQQMARLSIVVHPVGQMLSQLWHAIELAAAVVSAPLPEAATGGSRRPCRRYWTLCRTRSRPSASRSRPVRFRPAWSNSRRRAPTT